jgi:hypothetical protein
MTLFLKECVRFFLILLIMFAPLVQAQGKPISEKQKIEALIKNIEELKDAKFVRDNQEFGAKMAANHLRRKWNKYQEKIQTAQDFIKIVASTSSSGTPYRIKFKDREIESSKYLLEVLNKLE